MKQLKINVPKLLSNLNVVWHCDYKAIKFNYSGLIDELVMASNLRDNLIYSPAEYETIKEIHQYCE